MPIRIISHTDLENFSDQKKLYTDLIDHDHETKLMVSHDYTHIIVLPDGNIIYVLEQSPQNYTNSDCNQQKNSVPIT